MSLRSQRRDSASLLKAGKPEYGLTLKKAIELVSYHTTGNSHFD